MEDLILETNQKLIGVSDFNEENELVIDVSPLDGGATYTYFFLTPTQAAQLRDHLTEALNKLK